MRRCRRLLLLALHLLAGALGETLDIDCLFTGAKMHDQQKVARSCGDLVSKIVALYFCRRDDKGCKQFGPVLRHFHSLHHERVQVVFVSADESSEKAEAYFSEEHGDWFALAWDDKLSKELRVRPPAPSRCTPRSSTALLLAARRMPLTHARPPRCADEAPDRDEGGPGVEV